MGLRFEWNAVEAAANLADQGVSFEEAASVFDDPMSITLVDESDSIREARFVTIVMSGNGRLLVVIQNQSMRPFAAF